MKFIFHQNYNFKSKLFGTIDYNIIIVNIVWDLFVFFLINFFNNLNVKIFLFFVLCFPLFLFSFLGFNGESITYVFAYIFNFIFKNKLLFFNKK